MKTIKLNTLIALMLTVFTLSSCDKVEEITQRDVVITPDYVEFTIPVIGSLDEITLGNRNVEINLDALIKEKASAFGIANVKSVNLTSLKVVLQDRFEDSNFKALERISAKIGGSNQATQVLATATNVDNTNKYELDLPVTGGNIELKDYLKSTSFNYTITGKAKSTTQRPVKARLYATYTFKLGL